MIGECFEVLIIQVQRFRVTETGFCVFLFSLTRFPTAKSVCTSTEIVLCKSSGYNIRITEQQQAGYLTFEE